MSRHIPVVAISLLLIISSACRSPSPPGPSSATKPIPEGSIRVFENTQATIEDMKIGVGNIWETEYTNEAGDIVEELTAGLWIYMRDDSSENLQVRVHVGQEVVAGGYAIRVLDVDEGSVTLLVSSLNDGP